MAAEPAFLDTSLIVAASVEAHPAHQVAVASVERLTAENTPLCISPQVCREFLVVLTRQPVAGRTFTVGESLEALETWRQACTLLDESERTVARCLLLVRDHEVRGKQVHDCNIVAVMQTHGIGRLVTRNPADFSRYSGIIVEPVRP